jgi:hypothetical protein
MQVPVRYRPAGSPETEAWQLGSSENISRSGILFQTAAPPASAPRPAAPLAVEDAVELAFELPSAVERRRPRHVFCRGRVVRQASGDRSAPVRLAVAFTHYRFRRGAMPPAGPAES